jgi:hypothetical protein
MLGQQGFPGASNQVPFANTVYGYPQQTSSFAPGLPQVPSWQHPAQQQPQQQAALQQQAMLHLLATQLAQPFTPQPLPGTHAFAGSANGTIQPPGAWQQPQVNPELNNPALVQSQQQLLLHLAQYHQWVAQQLAQLVVQQQLAGPQQAQWAAAQQAAQGHGNPYAGQLIPSPFMAGQFVPSGGQYIPSPVGASFVPGITMH